MKRERRRPSRTSDILLSPGGTDARDCRQVLLSLRKYLIHRRDVPNGKDFLFSGPPEKVHKTLARLGATEHVHSRGLQCSYTQIDDFFLLRVLGPPERQSDIESFFDL